MKDKLKTNHLYKHISIFLLSEVLIITYASWSGEASNIFDMDDFDGIQYWSRVGLGLLLTLLASKIGVDGSSRSFKEDFLEVSLKVFAVVVLAIGMGSLLALLILVFLGMRPF